MTRDESFRRVVRAARLAAEGKSPCEAEIAAAVEAEREACAKIAEECERAAGCYTCDAALKAAAAIRARGVKP